MADDVRLIDVISPIGNPAQPPHTDFHSLRLKAITLLTEATRLRDKPPEPCSTLSNGMPGSVQPWLPNRYGGNRAARESHPSSFTNLKAALDRLVSELPQQYKLPWKQWDEGRREDGTLPRLRIKKDTAVLVSASA